MCFCYRTFIQVRSSVIIHALLYIKKVTNFEFQKYTLVVENKVSVVTKDVELVTSKCTVVVH